MLQFRNIDQGGQNRIQWHLSYARVIFALLAVGILSQFTLAQSKPVKSKGVASVRTDDKGRKFINNIPLDVFFDNPLEVVSSNKNSVAASETSAEKTTETKATPSVPSATVSTGTSASGTNAWQDLLSMEELQGEIKLLRNNLTKAMSNQGSYNKEFKPIAIDGAVISALAGIVQQHAESVTWKDKAQYVRDFGAQLNQSSVGLGKENFDKTRSAFQRLTSVLDGSIPADAGDIPTTRPFHETASRKGLMKRIEKAKDWLKQDVNSDAKFKSMAGQIKHEAAIIAALATVITTDGYEYTSEDEYQKHAKTLIDGAREAITASQEETYDRFKQAIDRINKSCTDCHATYGNG